MSSKDDAARNRADYVRGLLEERAGYVQRGDTDRVAAVDAELARVQGKPQGRSETPTEPKPRARSRKRA